MKIEHLRVNHLERPVIDDIPEFSFYITSEKQDTDLESYQITVTSNGITYWDSGKVSSKYSSFIRYEGETLPSRTVYDVKVTARDCHGEEANAWTSFETGLYKEDWKAKWIECPFERQEHHMLSDGIENPVLLFSRSFSLKKKVTSARLYATSYGVYRPLVNEKRIDDREFAPEFTSYSKILYYQSYDVSSFLKEGENGISFLVGDGWYFNQQTAPVNSDIKSPSLLYQLEVLYEDGEKEEVFSDGSESCQLTDILYSDLFVGEKRDYTKEYSEKEAVLLKDHGYDMLCAQKMEPVRAVETFVPQRIFTSPKNELIVDFGQVVAGRCRIRLHEERNHTVTLEHTEILDKEENYFAALQARQRDIVICNGEEIEYEPVFTFHGFRYVRISGIEHLDESDITAVLYSTDKEDIGSFHCSDERFERLYKNIRYSQRNNTLSIPTDCPQREKAGWTGDVLIYGKTSMLNEGMIPFYKSWLGCLLQDQYPNGAVPIVCPYTKLYEFVVNKTMKDFDDSKPTGILEDMLPREGEKAEEDYMAGVAGWSDVIVWLPYAMYEITGDTGILEEYYPAMKKWIDNILFTASSRRNPAVEDPDIDRYLWDTGFHFGEWLVYGHNVPGFEVTKETSWYTAPLFGYKTLDLFTEISSVLRKEEEEVKYSLIKEKMADAIRKGVLEVSGQYDHYMGRYILALSFELCEGELKERYEKKLVSLIEENHGRLATGFLATPFLLDVLDDMGRHDLSLSILFSEELPSWLYEVKKGATTIWENWNAIEEDGAVQATSYDHYAFGVVDDYLFHEICGIKADPGFRRLVIKPDEEAGFKGLYRTFLSEQGPLEVKICDGVLSLKIPCSCEADVYWKGKRYHVGSGEYQWK